MKSNSKAEQGLMRFDENNDRISNYYLLNLVGPGVRRIVATTVTHETPVRRWGSRDRWQAVKLVATTQTLH